MPKLPSGVSIVTESALSLIFKDGPRGQFLCLTKDQDGNAKICAVDNNTGDAWTEDFNSLTAALYWLENQAATPNEAETYAAAKAAEQYDDPLREGRCTEAGQPDRTLCEHRPRGKGYCTNKSCGDTAPQ